MKTNVFVLALFGMGMGTALAQPVISPAPVPTKPATVSPVPATTLTDEPARIKFEKEKHDFGEIIKGKPVEYAFKFTNTYDKEVQLKTVKASCGCTTPKWEKTPVGAGKTAEIVAGFNAASPGPFTKTITVTYDTLMKPIILTITGTVKDTAKAVAAPSIYTFPQGGLSFDKVTHTVGTLDSDKSQNVEFKVKNTGKAPLKFVGPHEMEGMFEVKIPITELQPGQESTVSVLVKGEKYDAVGPFSKKITLVTNDDAMPKKELTLTGTFNKVFSKAELDAAPNIQFEKMEYNGGTVIEGEKVVAVYKFTNTGKSVLEVSSVKGSCGCTVPELKQKTLQPGESTELTATFDSRGRVGDQTKTITVNSNDLDAPNLTLKLTCKVEKDPFHAGDVGPAAGGASK